MPGFGSAGRMLQVGPLLSMPDEKPAGRITGVWKKAVHAGLRHRGIKNNLGLPVFVGHHIVVFDADAAKGLAISRQTISKHAVVRGIRDSQQGHRSQERSQRDSPESSPERWVGFAAGFVALDRGHALNYTRARTGPETEVLTILHKKLGSIYSSPHV
jgi:hypothetical protein